MCGFAGFILAQNQIGRDTMAAIARSLRHRGPDDEGYAVFNESQAELYSGVDTPASVIACRADYTRLKPIEQMESGGAVQFIYRRLSIIDLSPLGHQPMCYRSRYWLIFNGEIYNYRELRQALLDLGHQFQSQTDSEVILASYAEWGADCLKKFNGMFALAIYDNQDQTIFIARDRFGVKPLYYYRMNDGSLSFASEIKVFKELKEFKARLNHQLAFDFLSVSLQDHTNGTMFQSVHQIPAAHYLLMNTKDITNGADLVFHQYYSLPTYSFKGSYAQAEQEFRDLLFQSVALRMRSDVPIGTCLSGGIDSSSILAVASQLLQGDNSSDNKVLESFSACFDDKNFDERPFIKHMVTRYQPKAHYIFPKLADLFHELPKILWFQDEPFGSTSIFAEWCIYKSVKETGIKVMLGGQGADEQLAGYHMYLGVYLAGLAKNCKFGGLLREWWAMRDVHSYSNLDLFMRFMGNLAPRLIQPSARILRRTEGQFNWLNPNILQAETHDSLVYAGSRTHSVRHLSFGANCLDLSACAVTLGRPR